MANIFSNAVRSVKTHDVSPKKELNDLDRKSEAVSTHEAFTEMKKEEISESIANSVLKKMRNEIVEERTEAIVFNSLTEGKLNVAANKVFDECRLNAFKNIVMEFYMNSLWLDKSYVKENINELYDTVSTYIDNAGGYKLLKEAIDKNPTDLLKTIDKACTKLGKQVSLRKVSEMATPDDAKNPDSTPNDEEKKDFDYDKGGMDVERISQLVKDKVLTVIQDEKKREEAESERLTAIEDELKGDDKVKDDKSLTEALHNIVVNQTPYEDSTLFNSLLRNAYSTIMKENVAINSASKDAYDNRHRIDIDYDPDRTLDDINADMGTDSTIEDKEIHAYDKRHDVDSVTGNLDDEDLPEDLNDDLALENSVSINMDDVLGRAIIDYTLMETLYTLKLEHFSRENVRHITQTILNPILESGKNNESNKFIETRSEFFKMFNKLKNLVDVDKTKDDLTKFIEKCKDDEETVKHIESLLNTGISQLKGIIEKNEHLKDKYQPIIDWCYEFIQ